MLGWWTLIAELGAARARAVPIPTFLQELRLERDRRWPCFLVSGLLHLALLLLLPALGDWLEATRPEHWVRRYPMLPSVEIRVPERLYFAANARPLGGRRTAGASAPHRRGPQPEQKLSIRTAARPGPVPRRRFELPRIPARPVDQTLLQPDFPADLPTLARLSLPDLFFWAPLPTHPAFRIRKPFVSPGSAEPFAQPPSFDAPPQLTPPNWETMASVMQAASASSAPSDSLLPPAISLPIRLLELVPRPAKSHLSVERNVGDPLSVLALNLRVRPVREDLVIPAGNQLALSDSTGSGAAGQRAGWESGERDSTAEGRAKTGAHGASPSAGSARETAQGQESVMRAGGAHPAEPAQYAAESTRALAHAANTTVPNRAPSAGGAAAVAASAQLTSTDAPAPQTIASPADPRRELASPAKRIEHPPHGVADVVVVQPGPMDGMLDSSGALSGRPVYSVYLQVGASREWILQYCVPGEDQSVTMTGGVVRLAQPSPLVAPYPKVTYLPTLQRRSNSYLLIHGYLGPDGRLENLRALRSADREEAVAVLPVLEQWEFRPAMREGRPVRVEILLAIPRS